MKPRAIKRVATTELIIRWQDNSEDRFASAFLRARCPCATCMHERDESTRQGVFSQPIARQADIKEIELSGHNAMIIVWGDGHKSGIYTWDYLLELRDKLGSM